MAKKGNRVQVILECTEHKTREARNISLHHDKNKKEHTRQNGVEKIQPILKKMTVHKEIK